MFCRLETVITSVLMLKAHCMSYIVYIYIKDIDLAILLRILKQICELLYKLLLLSGYLDSG